MRKHPQENLREGIEVAHCYREQEVTGSGSMKDEIPDVSSQGSRFQPEKEMDNFVIKTAIIKSDLTQKKIWMAHQLFNDSVTHYIISTRILKSIVL